MKNTILILISSLFLTGCMEKKEVTSLQDRGGVKYEVNSERPFTGKYVEKYENGQKRLEVSYKDDEYTGDFCTSEEHKENDESEEAYRFGIRIKELIKDRNLEGLFSLVHGQIDTRKRPRERYLEGKNSVIFSLKSGGQLY